MGQVQGIGARRRAAARGLALRGETSSDPAAEALVGLVAGNRKLSPVLLFRRTRRARVAASRQLAMYLMHVSLGRTMVEVGRFFDRDRSTVAYACARIEDLREAGGFDEEVDRLEELLAAQVAQLSDAAMEQPDAAG